MLYEAHKVVYDGWRIDGDEADFFTLSTKALFLVKEQHLIFTTVFGRMDFFTFVRLFCAKELQAFDDYFTMYTSGFSEEDIQTVMKGYL